MGLATTDLNPILYESDTEIDKKTQVEEITYTLKSEYNTGFAVLELPVNHVIVNAEGRKELASTKIKLQLGVDMPDRNALKRMESLLPSLKVLTWFCSNDCFRYAVVGKTEKDCAIWAGVYSNLRFLTEPKKKAKTQ